MIRITNTITQKRKKILKQTAGFYGRGHTCRLVAKEKYIKALEYNYISRRTKKRDARANWISQITNTIKLYTNNTLNYSSFIHKLNQHQIQLNRKMLSQLAISEPKTIVSIISTLNLQ
jgi:large subunit ribosomal protein L20